ncbi:MAG: sugar ABC transporter ATP-binding protein, partial [Clostridia bacterium]|nr:sugar ABC transporter ATP-binding protein [Clostridia bacterium]
KSFGHIRALHDVSLSVFPGEVLALVGDNGAGKSTLIKILTGVLQPDSGAIEFEGCRYEQLTPKKSMEAGLSAVYQDLALVELQDVAANVFLGRELRKGPFLQRREMYSRTRALIQKLGMDLPDVTQPVSRLSGGQRQGVAVARSMNQGGRFFIFDEPTAAMGVNETAAVVRLIQELARKGYGVLIISHDLPQVLALADRIVILRHGCVAAKTRTDETDIEKLIATITGAGEKRAYDKR